MPKLAINGTSLEYFEHGSGEPLVMIHGSASDYRTWGAHPEGFARHYRVIHYSRRFHWPNDPLPEGADYSMLQHVDDLEALMDALDVAPAHLVGTSYGAFLALLLAIRAPAKVKTLALGEPPVVPLFISNQPKPAELLKLLFTRPAAALAIMRFGATGVQPATEAARRGDMETAMRIFGKVILGDAYDRMTDARREQVRVNSYAAEFTGSGFAALSADQVRSVRTPVLLVVGEQSPALFHHLIKRLEELLPDSQRAEISGSHNAYEENPQGYQEAVLRFLQGNSSNPR